MEETHRYGKLEWFFYIVVLPLLFTALLSGIILQFLGFDITGKVANAAKHVPGVSKLLPQDQQETADSTPSTQPDPVQQKQEAEDKAKALENSKKQLEDDLVKKNAEIDQLKKQAEADKKKQDAEDAEAAPPPDPVKDMAKVYAQMSPAKAAAIMSNLSVTEAKEILSKMSSSQKAAILEKMEPLIASKILSS
jgi:flagellar motility protein MotE (MotC chaperone)